MPKPRLAVLLVTAVGALLLVWLTREAQPRTWPLPDGSVLSLGKVTFGANHVFRYGNRWQDFLYPIVPQAMRNKFHFKVATLTSGRTDSIVVWLQRSTRTSKPRFTRLAGPKPFCLAVLDEHGLESSLLDASGSISILAAGRDIIGLELHDYPHRARRIGIRIYSQKPEGTFIGEFTFRNKTKEDYPVWHPEPLPVSKHANDLEVSLLKLESGTAEDFPAMPEATGATAALTRATFAIREKNLTDQNWSVTRILATSASGERRGSPGGRSWGSIHSVDFQGPLWVDEPAWKLRVEVSRTTNYPPGQIWKITGVPVPQTKQLVGGGALTNMYQAELEFLGLSAPGALLPSRHVAVDARWNAHIRTPYPVDELRFSLIEVRDQLGHIGELRGVRSTTSDGGRGITPREMLYAFGFDLPEGAETLDLTFAVTRSVYVDFQVRPTLAKAKSGR